MINLDVKLNVDVKEIHYPIYFERRNICIACGAANALKFINIFGKESPKEVHPFDKIRCSNCNATYSICWDKEDDGKLYPSAIDPSIKRNFVNAFKTTFHKKDYNKQFLKY